MRNRSGPRRNRLGASGVPSAHRRRAIWPGLTLAGVVPPDLDYRHSRALVAQASGRHARAADNDRLDHVVPRTERSAGDYLAQIAGHGFECGLGDQVLESWWRVPSCGPPKRGEILGPGRLNSGVVRPRSGMAVEYAQKREVPARVRRWASWSRSHGVFGVALGHPPDGPIPAPPRRGGRRSARRRSSNVTKVDFARATSSMVRADSVVATNRPTAPSATSTRRRWRSPQLRPPARDVPCTVGSRAWPSSDLTAVPGQSVELKSSYAGIGILGGVVRSAAHPWTAHLQLTGSGGPFYRLPIAWIEALDLKKSAAALAAAGRRLMSLALVKYSDRNDANGRQLGLRVADGFFSRRTVIADHALPC